MTLQVSTDDLAKDQRIWLKGASTLRKVAKDADGLARMSLHNFDDASRQVGIDSTWLEIALELARLFGEGAETFDDIAAALGEAIRSYSQTDHANADDINQVPH